MTAKNRHAQQRACIDVPSLPLQLILQRHPDWQEAPVVIIREDKPQAPILWTNIHAQRHQIRPGMTYSAALAISSGLRAASIHAHEIEAHVEHLIGVFRKYSDRIEPAQKDPGVFWLSTIGLEQLHPSLEKWAQDIKQELQQQKLQANIVIGFTRFATYALAHTLRPGILLLSSPHEEQRLLRTIRLERLQLDLHLHRILEQLGIKTLDTFLRLPPDEIRARLGESAFRLYQWAQGDLDQPIQDQTEVVPVAKTIEFDFPETSKHRLLFLIKHPLSILLHQLAQQDLALEILQIGLRFESNTCMRTHIRVAEPTLDEAQVLDLVRLHLDTLEYTCGVISVELVAQALRQKKEQLSLFAIAPKRDLQAGNRALARIRTEWGEKSVVQAQIREGHLPEAQYTWAPLQKLEFPQSNASIEEEPPPLIRRIYQKPQALPPVHSRTSRDEGWLLRGLKYGTVINLDGPYVLRGGWWLKPVHREYHFAETQHGRLFWVYYDRQRRRWFLHGEVE
jgi:protein ImuB